MDDYLLEDVLIMILIILPIKSLLRFRCVSKLWNSLIISTDFIASHLDLSANQAKPLLLLRGLEPLESYSLHLDDNVCLHNYKDLQLPFQSEARRFDVVGSCNGLICLSDIRHERTCRLFIWNPSTRKSLQLALPRLSGPHFAIMGFGFDSQGKDYKVVRIVRLDLSKRKCPIEFQVYSLKQRSWECIDAGLTLDGIVSRCLMPCGNKNPVLVNGVLHWIVYLTIIDGPRPSVLLSFDLSNDLFGQMALPECLVMGSFPRISLLAYRNSLAVAFNDYFAKYCEIWVMKEHGVRESWTKLFSIGAAGFGRALLFRKNGEILMREPCSYELISSDPQSQEAHNLGNGLPKYDYADYFVESLALLDESNETPTKKRKQRVRTSHFPLRSV